MNSVWHFLPASQKEREGTGGHATPKPVELVRRAVKTSCPDSGLTFDPFGGSGSTLIACEQTGRVCYMCEISPKYIDVIIKRWQNLTGKEAVNTDTGETFNSRVLKVGDTND
jgi:DNA modification methylase